MKQFIQFFVFVLAVTTWAGAVSPAWAQSDALPVALVRPELWQSATTDTGDSLSASWVDPKTENRIEIRAISIVRDQHADTLREAFDAQLIAGHFTRTSDPQERDIPLINATKRTGYWTEYAYTGAEVPISVITFSYTVSGMAIYVIGYFARPNRSEGVEALQYAISRMVDKN